MRRFNIPTVVYLLLVFASGIVVGVFSQRLYSERQVQEVRRRPRSEEFRQRFVEEMRSRLNLNSKQVLGLEGALQESRRRFDQLREKTMPEERAIAEDQIRNIRDLLSDAQRAEYDNMLLEREQRLKQRGKNSSSRSKR